MSFKLLRMIDILRRMTNTNMYIGIKKCLTDAAVTNVFNHAKKIRCDIHVHALTLIVRWPVPVL